MNQLLAKITCVCGNISLNAGTSLLFYQEKKKALTPCYSTARHEASSQTVREFSVERWGTGAGNGGAWGGVTVSDAPALGCRGDVSAELQERVV